MLKLKKAYPLDFGGMKMTDTLFRSKKKNIFVGGTSAAYLLITLLTSGIGSYNDPLWASWRYILNTLFIWIFSNFSTICILLYLLTLKKEYRLKKWILPFGFGLSCLCSLLSFSYSVSAVNAVATPYSITIFIFTCLSALAVLLCFVGTLFDFEFLRVFRAGLLLNIAVPVAALITDTVYNVINGYFDTYGIAGVNFTAIIEFLILMLFNIGLFSLTTNKE